MPSDLGPLSSLSFGQDVAEHDENLDAYFLTTSTYWAVVNDQTDVVLGAKGTGKSAIARYLSNPETEVPELQNVFLIPAFNIRGSVLFRRLSESAQPSAEATYRDLFLAYILGLAGNHLVETFESTFDVGRLREALHLTGLATQTKSVHSIWRRAIDRLTPRLGTTITISQDDAAQEDAYTEPVTIDALERLLECVYEFVQQNALRCWVVFDRLDEAFADDPALESAALRGLLRAQMDVSSFGDGLRAKLFLRLDIFERITTSQGFVNATHIRTTRISWDADSIHHLVALRLQAWNQRTGVADLPFDLTSPRQRRALCRRILPRKMDIFDSLVWLLLVTVDGTREYNPRNVITLLRNAQLEEIQITARQAEDIDTKPASLSHRALAAGYKQLSIARLNDTLYAESGIARQSIPKLRGRRTRFSREHLSEKLGVSGQEIDAVIQALIYVGFLRIDEDAYLIPPLYRPALFSSTHKAELVIGARDLEGVDDAAAGDIDMDAGESEASAPTQVAKRSKTPTRGRPGRPRPSQSGRDEFIPTGAPSEVVDEDAFAAEIHAELEIDDGEWGATYYSSSPPQDHTKPRDTDPTGNQSARSAADLSIKRPPSIGAQAVQNARALGEQGDAIGGYRLLHPKFTGHDGAACVAADLAYLSQDPGVVRSARDMLSSHGSAPAALGRSFVLAINDRDSDAAKSILTRFRSNDIQAFTIALTRMVSQVPEHEALFWRTALEFERHHGSGSRMPNLAILAASRVLAICRHYWESGSDAGFVGISGVRDQIWDQVTWASNIRHIIGWCWAYARDDPKSPPAPSLLPYQVISAVTVLESVNGLSIELRATLLDRLSRQLDVIDYEHRARFAEWGQYTPVVFELLEGPEARPSHTALRTTRESPSPSLAVIQEGDVDLLREVLRLETVRNRNPGILLSILGSRLRRVQGSFDYKKRGFATLLAFVTACAESSPDIQIARNDRGHPYVWLDEQGPVDSIL